MKTSIVVASIALAGFCSIVNAAMPNKMIVYSTEKSNGSSSLGKESVYTKTFDVDVTNPSDKDVDLSSFCLKSFGSDNKEFKLDMVDETLVRGTLKAGMSVKGMAVFSSEDPSIYNAVLITFSDDCK